MTHTIQPLLNIRHDTTGAHEIAAEHAALARQLAGMQRRLGEQVRASALRARELEEELLYLRAQLIVSRTCMLWGLGVVGGVRSLPMRRIRVPHARAETGAMTEASSVICQTGCVGHAHPWLEADGQCRRTGTACTQLGDHAEDEA